MANRQSSPVLNPLALLLESRRGSKLIIPSLENISPTWTVAKNINYELIREDYTTWARQYVSSFPLKYGFLCPHEVQTLRCLNDTSYH